MVTLNRYVINFHLREIHEKIIFINQQHIEVKQTQLSTLQLFQMSNRVYFAIGEYLEKSFCRIFNFPSAEFPQKKKRKLTSAKIISTDFCFWPVPRPQFRPKYNI